MDRMQQDMQGMGLQSRGNDMRRVSEHSDRGFYMQPASRSGPGPAHVQPGDFAQSGYSLRPLSGEASSLHSDPSQAMPLSPQPGQRFSGGSLHSNADPAAANVYAGAQQGDYDASYEYYGTAAPDDASSLHSHSQQYDSKLPTNAQPAYMQPMQASTSNIPHDLHHMDGPPPPGGFVPMQQPFTSQQIQMQHIPGAPPPPQNGYTSQLSLPPGSTMHPSLNRAMSSASSLNMMPFRSPMQSLSTSHLPPPPQMTSSSAPVLERQRTMPASTMRDEPKAAITKAAIDEYRNRIKADPDPETQFLFAKYLIEAARKVGQTIATTTEPDSKIKGYKRFRDSLLQESLKIMKKLATQSVGVGKPAYADAQFFYANLLSSGSLGLAVDPEKAYHLYVQASKQNHPAATYRTAYCNEVGVGTKRDYNRAVLFYRKASALGDPNGMFKLGMILLRGTLDQQKNGKEAVTWLNRAAQQADENNPQALHELAMLYENPPDPNSAVGPTVPPSDSVAADLYMQAARLGYAPSQNRLGQAFEFGHLGLPVDPRRSIAYYSKAAQRGYGHAELALSGWYLTGTFF